jgi:peptide/nickel transport system substrate-binding protein
MSEPNYWTTLAKRSVSRRRLLAATGVAGAGITTLGLAACAGAKPTGQSTGQSASGTAAAVSAGPPQSGGSINVYLPYNPPLDPQKVSAAAQQAVGGSYSRLFRFKTGTDPKVITDHDLENDLAVSIESPDAITWTVKLRPDAKFHNIAPVNGHAVEAEDIKATFTRALDPATANPNRGTIGMIDAAQIQTPDKQTVVFKLNYAYAPFRKTLASPTYSMIFPREALAGAYDPSKTVIGSGPFVADTLTPDVANVFKKNPDWFEKGQPYIDNARVAVIPDRAQQLAQFAAGNLDELILDNIDDVKAAQQRQPKAQVFKTHRASPLPIYYQMGDPASPFQDVRLRRAVSMALDRDALGKAVYNGEWEAVVYVPAYMGKWSLSINDLPQEIKQYYTYNLSEAKKLIQAAGASNLSLRLAYPVNGPGSFAPTPSYKQQAETISNMLNQAGLKTTIITQDYNKDFVDAGKGSRQGYFDKDVLMFAGAGSNSEADEWLYSYFHSKSTSNQEHLNDPTYDAMVDKQRTLVNEDERLKAVIDIQKYLADKMYVVSTVGTYEWAVVSPRLQNYQYSNSLGKNTETYAKLWVKG